MLRNEVSLFSSLSVSSTDPYRILYTDVAKLRFATTRSSTLMGVKSRTSGISDSHGVTGGVYKTRERIHRDILIRDY